MKIKCILLFLGVALCLGAPAAAAAEKAPAVSPVGTPVIVKLELRNLLPAEKLITYAEMCARQGERPDDH